MQLKIPPRVTFAIEGFVPDGQVRLLLAEAGRQSEVLTEAMSFQGLRQGRRVARVGDFEFVCRSVFGLESVVVQVAGGEEKEKEKELTFCWCTCQFAEGVVLEIIEAAAEGCLPVVSESTYPDCAVADIAVFVGKRYLVSVCQCSEELGEKWVEFVCVPTDFEEFEVEDKVVVLYLDAWIPEECSENACKVTPRDKTEDVVVDALDGQFVIMPYEIE